MATPQAELRAAAHEVCSALAGIAQSTTDAEVALHLAAIDPEVQSALIDCSVLISRAARLGVPLAA